jgi:uncharacterized protein (UPF0335 family)
MTDPRDQLRMAIFDLFSEANSLCKQDLNTGVGQRSARISLRRMEMATESINELQNRMRKFIQEVEGAGFDE